MLRILPIAFTLALIIGCADDNPTSPGGGGSPDGVTDTLDARSGDQYYYFNLAPRARVDISDSAASTNSDWHIAFSRVDGRLNGGVSGPLGVVAVDLADIGHADSANFNNVTAVPLVDPAEWESDKVAVALNEWYAYNPSTHTLAPTRLAYVMRSADGKWAKVMVDSLNNPGAPPNMGTIGIRFYYAADGSNNLAGGGQFVELDGTSGSVFFSLVTGGEVAIGDPSTSTAWDIHFSAYDAKTNGGISGPGEAAVLPMEDTPFDSIAAAPVGAPLFSDTYGSVFGAATESGSQWYDYNPVMHEIVSKGHVYIIKFPNGSHYKLKIENYYRVVDGSPESGWITIRHKAL